MVSPNGTFSRRKKNALLGGKHAAVGSGIYQRNRPASDSNDVNLMACSILLA